MMDNPEINDALAEKVMGWHKADWLWENERGFIPDWLWNPMVNREQAMQVKDKMVADGWSFALECHLDALPVAAFNRPWDSKSRYTAQYVCDAGSICLAALQAKGVEVE